MELLNDIELYMKRRIETIESISESFSITIKDIEILTNLIDAILELVSVTKTTLNKEIGRILHYKVKLSIYREMIIDFYETSTRSKKFIEQNKINISDSFRLEVDKRIILQILHADIAQIFYQKYFRDVFEACMDAIQNFDIKDKNSESYQKLEKIKNNLMKKRKKIEIQKRTLFKIKF